MALSLASSSSSSRTWLYDVFPSFSGEDVRVTFLSHFLKELDRKLIISFKDNEIQRSRSLDPELKQAIKDSRIAVVIFSKKYASSSWCLNELLEIVKCSKEECGQKVIPVFYGLDPSHVRKQTGDFGKIFEETCKNKTEEEKIQWSEALTDVANTLGYHSVNWDNEAKMIEEIVSDVLDKLLLTPSKDSESFVGIEGHIAEMSLLLKLESEEVRMVGLWGFSGIGKTTIARVMFNRLSRHFQGRIFIDMAFLSKTRVIYSKANPDDYNMKLHLQSRFLSKILGKKDIEISQLGELGERLKHHKLLICIDDLDDQVVLDSLVGQPQWFGSGSRIIVVINDKHILRAHEIDHIYEVCLPSVDLAEEMLCQYAFRKNSPPEGFRELVVTAARLAGCLPLALSVLGSSLRGRNKEYWVDSLSRLRNGKNGEIEKILRISYDGLTSEEDKTIFRYIACYFSGEKVTDMKLLLADSGLSVNAGLENLADKSLIHVREGRVEMHRLLQEMGRRIVHLEKPENREFLEDSQDIFDVLSKGIGTEKVLSISLGISEIEELHVHENAFKRMSNLRFLKVLSSGGSGTMKLCIPKSFDYSKLRLLRWDNYQMRCMPYKFRPENLVKFEMRHSKLEKLWEGVVSLPCLKEMDLRYSYDLIEMPDLSKASNLETLDLIHCHSLLKLPSSIPHPNKLKNLNMNDCQNLETIPIGISLKSLERLHLDSCSRLRTFPQISTNIIHLNLSETAIEDFPSDLHMENLRLEKLSYLNMRDLKSKKLWEGVQPLTLLKAIMTPSLEKLYLSEIPTLVELPSSFQNLHQLQELEIKDCINLETLPTGINLRSLWKLSLCGCSRLRTFPDISTNIKYLHLCKTAIEEVPWWIEKFSNLLDLYMKGCINMETVLDLNVRSLRCLNLSGCSRLRKFPHFSTNIKDLNLSETAIEEVPPWIEKSFLLKVLWMNGCINLETLPTGINLPYLYFLDLSGCSRLRTFPDISTNITGLDLSGTAIEEVPCWIEKLSKLRELKMKGCIKLETLPTGINLPSLDRLDLSGCINLETLPTGTNLPSLDRLDLSGCSRLRNFPDISTNIRDLYLSETEIEEVPCWIEKFSSLRELKMNGCINLETLPTGINLPSLRKLDLSGCSRLKTFPDISTNIFSLNLSETAIEEVPCWIEKFDCLEELKMSGCINLETLPTGINVQFLFQLNLSGCSVLRTFPDISTNIIYLDLSKRTIEEVPCSIEKFSWLRVLFMNGCINLETLPTGINLRSLDSLHLSGCSRLRTFPDISTNIKQLDLSETAIDEVPCWIEKFSNLWVLEMKGCNKLKSVSLNIYKLEHLREVDFSDCKAMTGATWSSSGGYNTCINFTNCLNLDKEALFQLKTYSNCVLRLSGEEVPSYFTHRTTGTSSSLTIPLLPSSLSQPFFRFRACIVLSSDKSTWETSFRFKGRFWNSFDSFGQSQYFQKHKTVFVTKKTSVKGIHLLILECSIQSEMNYTHVDLQLAFPSEYKVKEWGIRLCSSADNRLGFPDTLHDVFEANEDNMLNESGQGEESAGEDEVTEPSSKRMRIS